jgi:uncharacterized alpha/beta hydrolase family protein
MPPKKADKKKVQAQVSDLDLIVPRIWIQGKGGTGARGASTVC